MRSAADISAYHQLVAGLKASDGKVEHFATIWARVTVAKLLSPMAWFTYGEMVAAFVTVYKPLTAKGKPAATAGSLPSMPRARCSSVKFLLDNLAVLGVRELALAFASTEETSSSFGHFNAQVQALVKASKVASVPVRSAASAAHRISVTPAPLTIAFQVSDLIAALHDADADALECVTSELADLQAMISVIAQGQCVLAAILHARGRQRPHSSGGWPEQPPMRSMADSFAARGMFLNKPNPQGAVLLRRGPRKGMVADQGYALDPRGPTAAIAKAIFREPDSARALAAAGRSKLVSCDTGG